MAVEWQQRAACNGQTAIFDRAADAPESQWGRRARAICATCDADVRTECLLAALRGDEAGIWGGTTHRWRQLAVGKRRRARARAAATSRVGAGVG